jgi:hypothetical protein
MLTDYERTRKLLAKEVRTNYIYKTQSEYTFVSLMVRYKMYGKDNPGGPTNCLELLEGTYHNF